MTDLISRRVLFGNPERASVRLSPDGRLLAFLAPRDGVLNAWVAPVDEPDAARPVTDDRGRGLQTIAWAESSTQLLTLIDTNGDENWHVHCVDVDTHVAVDLTPVDGVAANIVATSSRQPDVIIVGLNDREPQLHDLYRVNLVTGERELLLENPGFVGFVLDEDLQVRFGVSMLPEGGMAVLALRGGAWEQTETIPAEDALTTSLVGLDAAGTTAYWMDSRGRDTAALFAVSLATGERKLLAEDPRADVSEWLVHPTTLAPQAAASTWSRRTWHVIDPSINADLAALRGTVRGDIEVLSRSLDDSTWIVAGAEDAGPVRYYRYRRATGQVVALFSSRPELEGLPLVPMYPAIIESRDHKELVSYYSIPKWMDQFGRPKRPLPMVLLVHGGPWARDTWGYDAWHQWLANRGYAVLSVNFRGSTGFGKDFLNAANREWAGKMHEDLLDAVAWAVMTGIADPKRVAIMGGSYGGYATLVGLTFTPDTFACGVDIVGPSSLVTLIESIPAYWKPMRQVFDQRIGHLETERDFLLERSPLSHVDRITKPLIIAQGANDPRVKQAEADQIVGAMRERDIPVTYALFPDEGHGFARAENRFAFVSIAEAFLAEHLGGRAEPQGDALDGSSMELK